MTSTLPEIEKIQKQLTWKRKLKRLIVRIYISKLTVPILLLTFYFALMIGLTKVADSWIVAIAATPLIFALILTAGCLIAYQNDFYA